MHVTDGSNSGETVRRTWSREEAPFTVNDLQSELSSNQKFPQTLQSNVPPDSEPATNASGLKAEAVRLSMHDAPQAAETIGAAAAATAHSSDAPAPANSAEGAEGGNGVLEPPPVLIAEQPPSPSATSSAGTTTEYPDDSLQAADTHPKASITPQHPPQHDPLKPAQPPSSTQAGPDRAKQEDRVKAGPSGAGAAPTTSSSHCDEDHNVSQAGVNGAPESEASATDAPTADSAAQSPPSRDASLNSEQLDMHVPEEQGDSIRALRAFPADTAGADAAAASVRTEFNTEADTNSGLEESPVRPQGRLEGGNAADVAEGQQPSIDETAHQSGIAAGSHESTDESVSPWETQANESDWADGEFAEAPASMKVETPDGNDLTDAPASVSTELPTDGSTGQDSLVLPQEAHADDSQWADNTFAAPAWPNAEQTTPMAPSTDPQAAAAGTGDTEDSGAQATMASSGESAGKLPSTDAELPSSPAASGVVDTAAAGEAGAAAGTNMSEQPGKGEAEGDDWGDDDDFGDFNDAGSGDDDGGFGAFNEAEAVTPTSADASVQSPETTPLATQPLSVPPVAQDSPQPSLLSRLLNATQQDLPSMLRHITDPLTAPFATLPPLSELPIKPDGPRSSWHHNGQALLEHHMQQAQQLAASDVLPTGGLLGQPQPGSHYPAAPSLSRFKVTGTRWPGSRGDVRLLARLGLSQAGLQDERDAEEKALAAKNRWRRKSSSQGLTPAGSSGPAKPQGGPLSYLSTVTTAGASDWGSQPLDNISQQSSDLPSSASTASPGASTPAADDGVTSRTAASRGQRGRRRGGGSNDSRQELGRQLSSADESPATKGRAGSRSSRASAEASGTHSHTTRSVPQVTDLYSQPHSTTSKAQVSSEGASSAAQQRHGAEQNAVGGLSNSQSHWQGSAPAGGAASNTAEEPDWSAFGGAASNEAGVQHPQHAMTSHTASPHQSGHAMPAPGTGHMSAAQQQWSAFGQANSASNDAEVSEAAAGFDNTNPFLEPGKANSASNHAGFSQAAAVLDDSNPFLEPGQDPWQRETEAVPTDTAEVARMASGDSFGDFNAPGERQDDFEVAAWGEAAVPEGKADEATAASPADPFAASASFTDFAALLDPSQADLLGGLDTVANVDTASPQAPSIAQLGLSELQGVVDLGLPQGAQTSEQLRSLAKQLSGYASPGESRADGMQRQEIVVAGISLPDLSFMLASDLTSYRT